MKKPVEFLKSWSRYNAGDVAGFEDETYDALIAGKVARPYRAPAASTSLSALSAGGGTDADAAMEQVRAAALREENRLKTMADGIQQRKGEIEAQLDKRQRDVVVREVAVAKREAALDQGEKAGKVTGTETGVESIIAADQKGPMPPNGAAPPTGEGHEGEKAPADTVTGGDGKDDLPAQGTAKKAK